MEIMNLPPFACFTIAPISHQMKEMAPKVLPDDERRRTYPQRRERSPLTTERRPYPHQWPRGEGSSPSLDTRVTINTEPREKAPSLAERRSPPSMDIRSTKPVQ
nr:hypothetical protein Q903MT_gene2302 [Picea sitchensis]